MPPGTVTEGFRRLTPLLEPIYAAFLQRNAQSAYNQADETRWLVFVDRGVLLGPRAAGFLGGRQRLAGVDSVGDRLAATHPRTVFSQSPTASARFNYGRVSIGDDDLAGCGDGNARAGRSGTGRRETSPTLSEDAGKSSRTLARADSLRDGCEASICLPARHLLMLLPSDSVPAIHFFTRTSPHPPTPV